MSESCALMSEGSGSSNLMKGEKTDHELQSCMGRGACKEGKAMNSVESGLHRTSMGKKISFLYSFSQSSRLPLQLLSL